MSLFAPAWAPAIFPGNLVVITIKGDQSGPALLPEEEEYVRQAVPKRKREFARGRACARRALARFERGRSVLPVGDDRAPVWPAGLVGSITHCADLTAAVVASRLDWVGIGIDAEPAQHLDAGLLDTVCTPAERARLEQLPDSSGLRLGMLAFCAKEAVYKAVSREFPNLAFQDLEVTIDESAGTVHVSETRDVQFGAEALAVRWVDTGEHFVVGAVRGA